MDRSHACKQEHRLISFKEASNDHSTGWFLCPGNLQSLGAVILHETYRSNITLMKSKNIIYLALATGVILLIPFAAMQFSAEVAWTAFDFTFAGTLIFGAGLLYQFLSVKGGNTAYRVAAGLALAAALLLVWINGAVGIIGNEGHPANLLYLAVILIGILGAAFARLRPRGMSNVMFLAAVAQALVPVIALFLWAETLSEPPELVGVFMLNGIFALLLIGSGLLFRHSGAAIRTA
jgi:hypothetical protein